MSTGELEIAHGEIRGFRAGCREVCCKTAMSVYNSRWRSDQAIHGLAGRRRVSSVGTVRRVQGLIVQGWSAEEIARECGWTSGQAVTNLLMRGQVKRETAEKIRLAHDALWRRALRGELRERIRGPRLRTMEQARAKGWVSTAAWDDVDDPRERPKR